MRGAYHDQENFGYMKSSISLKIWTLIAHALILIGMGHGIATLGVVEIMWLGRLFHHIEPADDSQVSEASLRIVAVLCLAGQLIAIWSMRAGQGRRSQILYVIGLFLLWTSVLAYAWSIRHDNYAHLAVVTCAPFAVFTVWSLFGTRIRSRMRRKTWPEAE